MDETTLAFLSQPISMLANREEPFVREVIDTFRRWVATGQDGDVVTAERDGVVILSSTPVSAWNIVLVRHGFARAEVWDIDFRQANLETSSILDRFAPFVGVGPTAAVIELKARQLDPGMFGVLAEAHSLTWHATPHSRGSAGDDRQIARLIHMLKRHRSRGVPRRRLSRVGDERYIAMLEAVYDEVGGRSDARDPRFQTPPATAGALARWFAENSLAGDGMDVIPSRRRGRLGRLPELEAE